MNLEEITDLHLAVGYINIDKNIDGWFYLSNLADTYDLIYIHGDIDNIYDIECIMTITNSKNITYIEKLTFMDIISYYGNTNNIIKSLKNVLPLCFSIFQNSLKFPVLNKSNIIKIYVNKNVSLGIKVVYLTELMRKYYRNKLTNYLFNFIHAGNDSVYDGINIMKLSKLFKLLKENGHEKFIELFDYDDIKYLILEKINLRMISQKITLFNID
jgi:hypothetical protein